MSRNFEEAYKAEVQLNIPDLWDRIESALPEKKVSSEQTTVSKKAENEPVVMKEVTTNFNHKSKKKSRAWMKWASLAAAALFMVILLPAIAGLGILGVLGSSSSDMAANESAAAPEMMYQDVKEEPMEEITTDAEYNMTEGAVEEFVTMDSAAESWEEGECAAPTVEENASPEENALMSDERTVLAMGMKAKVVGCEWSSDQSIYCRMWLEIPEEAYETFAECEFFVNGQLEVRYYYDDIHSVPEGGNTYKFDIIEVGGGSWLVAKLPDEN
ncbi:MAG: hypothetical protein IJ397_05395 [Lachnospiraceae bacterium]|nr:hypothetical protein [Lachnospiraceae bacterium]